MPNCIVIKTSCHPHKKRRSLASANAFSTDSQNHLIAFNTRRPSKVIARFVITGLQPGEVIVGLDFRPANGVLYALGSTSRIYTLALPLLVKSKLIAATQIGSGPFTPALEGTAFGFDFNPTVDRIRIVSNTGQNLRVNPDTLAVIVDTSIAPPTTVVGAAYTNSFSGATSTTLYVLASNNNTLAIQSPPNDGVITTVGPLNVLIDDHTGFDITSATNNAYAVFTRFGKSYLYSIDLGTGNATIIGAIGCRRSYLLNTLAIRVPLLL